MQQVTDWLEKLVLGQYAQRFAENDIDFVVLGKLNEADLKELGVTSLGHRKRLLELSPKERRRHLRPRHRSRKDPTPRSVVKSR